MYAFVCQYVTNVSHTKIEEDMTKLTFWAFLEPKVEVKKRLPKTTAPMRIGTCFGNFIFKCGI